MADIFISYAKADRNQAQQLAALLEAQGRTTWWDTDVAVDQSSRGSIDRELESAHKVVVLWSKASIGSPFVLHEAITARDAGKLVLVKTADIQISDIARPLRPLPVLDVSDLAAIVRAVSVRDEKAIEIPARASRPEVEVRAPPPTRPIVSADRQSTKFSARMFAVAAAVVAVVAAAVIFQPELFDSLSWAAAKLPTLLK
jgi:hypothetical protein